MTKYLYSYLLFFFSVLFGNSAGAQTTFSEGVIKYRVTMNMPEGRTEAREASGSYTVYVKNKYIRKEFKLDNGFESVMIFEGHDKGHLLRKANDKTYAVQLDMANHNRQYRQYEKYTLKPSGKNKEIAGHKTESSHITYADGSTCDVYTTQELQPANPDIFERFPGIKVLPLEFTIKNDDGMTMHFKAEKVSLKPLETAYFRVPEGAILITSEEYREMNK